ncbi:MAG: NADH-quinone oxidoreductase subunit L [Acidimicrobiia bacterium]|nr:NADH-quinone oxidoreductase subunit L [Acidimicrobiia bacterium]
MDLLLDNLWLIIALPLAGAIALHFAGRFLPEPLPGIAAAGAIGLAFVIAAIAFVPLATGDAEPRTLMLWEWMPGLGAAFEIRWDQLSALMTLIITGVGMLIHIYSVGYMHGDPRFSRFFTYLNLFAASMLTLVLASNFAMMFVGWELVGLCSYLLISFWFTRPSAAAAGKKAFVVNRIGDFAFIVGLMLIFSQFGSLSMSETVLNHPGEVISPSMATAIAILFLIGAAGKSAQIPLYVWLPDAMEGPTPVSALIHAATMVTAGVYLIARNAAIFELSPVALPIVATVGAATALVAALIAIGQNDIKKVLAYSTVSQLGYMFLAVGSAGYVAGVFHLMTHAFFKALLFLGAGSVIHGMHEEQDMRKMGGLRKAMPITHATMLVATLAIAGIFPFAGFFSKDEILAAVFANGGYYFVLWGVGLFTAFLTAFYMTRQYIMVFWGTPRWVEGLKPHESSLWMTVPLMVLAVLSAGAGFINAPQLLTLEHYLDPVFEALHPAHLESELPRLLGMDGLALGLALVSLAVALTGIGTALYVYARSSERFREWFANATRRPMAASENAFWVDKFYGKTIVLPGKKLAQGMATFDSSFVDGTVNSVAGAVKRIGMALKPLQTGYVRSYGAGFVAGVIGLVIFFLTRGGV